MFVARISTLPGADTGQCIPFLLERGAEICMEDAKDRAAYDQFLIQHDCSGIARQFPQLLCKQKICFDLAAGAGDVEIMGYLLSHGADINSSVDGRSVLVKAVRIAGTAPMCVLKALEDELLVMWRYS